MVSATGILVEEFSILELAILILGAVGLVYACSSIIELGEDFAEYVNHPNKENAYEILGKALEAEPVVTGMVPPAVQVWQAARPEKT